MLVVVVMAACGDRDGGGEHRQFWFSEKSELKFFSFHYF